MNKEVNEILVSESDRIRYHLKTVKSLPKSSYIVETMTVPNNFKITNAFGDTLIFDTYFNSSIPYREFDFVVNIDDQRILVSLRHVLLEPNKLVWWVFWSTALVMLLLVLGLFFINQKISKNAWKPFIRNLSKLKDYNINRKSPVHLESSGINEFESINQVVSSLMKQVEKDFQNLKEFNENISHEMQTPLAIIRNKMVLLLESENLNEKELQWLQSAYQEVNKLSKIGKSLTLISRIENQEFTRIDSVDIRVTIDNIISNMVEIIQFKNIQVETELDDIKIKCDPILANILFTNLIKNAIQHNYKGGYIRMSLDEDGFKIQNTGQILQTETAQLFNRFRKVNKASDNLGLGLAINQEICVLYGFQLIYEHQDGIHKFSLLFNT